MTFPVVGIGAPSLAGEEVARILKKLPADSGMAFVLIQESSSRQAGIPVRLLARSTVMPVTEASRNTRIEFNNIYVVPPDTVARIKGPVLRVAPLGPRSKKRRAGAGRPVDSFFHSLAQDRKSMAAGIILPGTGADGAAGLQAILDAGGAAIPVNRIVAELAKIGCHGPAAPTQGANQRTMFFLDSDVFEELATVIPRLIRNQASNLPLRVWVPGCGEGEEVYSIAMSVAETMLQSGAPIHLQPLLQIFGTDSSDSAIAVARKAVYPESEIAALPPERRARFFVRLDGGYQIAKSIREMCVFAQHNPLVDPPFSHLNLISCRNLRIDRGLDCSPQGQESGGEKQCRQIATIFHYALKPGGYLLPGHSVNVSDFPVLFSPADNSRRMYRRNVLPEPGRLQLSDRTFDDPSRKGGLSVIPHIPMRMRNAVDEEIDEAMLERTVERIVLAEYGPTWVLVNKDLNVVAAKGDTIAYLQLAQAEKAQTANQLTPPQLTPEPALQALRKEVRAEVARLLDAAKRGQARARPRVLHTEVNGSIRAARLEVRAIPIDEVPQQAHYLVVFQGENSAAGAEVRRAAAVSRDDAGPRATELLRHQLVLANHRLEATLRELDAANHGLTTANEEIQTSNEELRTANEELQTSREELQSTNEELNVVNEELESRNIALGLLGDDLENLLSSTTIPILMLDSELRIKRVTPAAERLFNARTSDVGLHIGQIGLRVSQAHLESLVRRVMETSAGGEIELQDREDRWHMLRVRPYRTAGSRIEGTVLTMIDIDQLRRAKRAADSARQFAESVIEAVQNPLLVLRGNLQVRSANHAFLTTYDLQGADVENRLLEDIGGTQWKLPGLHAALQRILRGESSAEFLECEQDIPNAGWRNVLLHARRIRPDGENEVLIAIQDITAQKLAEHRMIDEQERLKRSVQSKAEELQQTETALHESEDALRRSRENLRALAASLLNAHEEERRRVSRELHDDASQNMAKLQFDIETLEQTLPQGLAEEKIRLLQIRDGAGQLSNDLRRIAHALHPSTLDHLGLTVALRAYCREFSKRTRIRVKFTTARVPAKIPQQISSSFYRITQEALRNVAKHSPGASVGIWLTGGNGDLKLVIRDHGPGFDREAIRSKHGLGLISMEERARLINGSFNLDTHPGHGVAITVTAPLT